MISLSSTTKRTEIKLSFMRAIVIFLMLTTVFGSVANAQDKLNFDGYYVSIPDSNSMSMFKYYLRFYPDGTVIGVTTAGKPANLIPWFKKENTTPSKGKYTLTETTIKFSMTSEQGEVNYEG